MIEQIITSSILIAAILIVSFLMESRVDPRIKYALWLLVVIKLLIPVPAFQSTVSVMNIVNQIDGSSVRYLFIDNEMEKANESKELSENKQTKDQTPVYEQTENSEAISSHILPKIKMADICYFVWIAGMLICAGIFVWSNVRFSRKVRSSRVLTGRYKNKLNVYITAGITGPCLSGFFHPSIYLQKDRELSNAQRTYVLAHEYVHYRHGDHVWAVVRCICVILYWYHPLVWMAAFVSIKDSELACDRGTLKLVGKENYKEYGKALIEIAGGMPEKPSRHHVLGCTTSATGGREMKRRMRLIARWPRTKLLSLITLLFVCTGIAGCTFGSAVDTVETKEEAAVTDDTFVLDDTIMTDPILADPIDERQPLSDEVQTANAVTYTEADLHEQAEADMVCILVEPSILRYRPFYYYIPADEEQEWLINRMESLDLSGTPSDGWWEGKKETGWRIVYNDIELTAFEGGYLYCTYDDENGAAERLVEDPKLCDYIQIMLQEKLDYYQYDIAKIENIVSARLDVCSASTDGEIYSQTITDAETLDRFANWFSSAEYIKGGAQCGNEYACLEMTMANGEVIRLSIATDSCSNFAINGVYYDYRPTPVWDNREFFGCFNEIPWNWAVSWRFL